MEYPDVPLEDLAHLRPICDALPETYEEQAWTGRRWRIRKRTFAHVLVVDSGDEQHTILTFRSQPPELDYLRNAGHPFFLAGWGRDVMGMVLDDRTDWGEVAELLADSFCVMAPKKLAAVVRGDV